MRITLLAFFLSISPLSFAQRLLPAPEPVTGAPYHATRVITTYRKLADGTTIEKKREVFEARDSMGRTAERFETEGDPVRPETKHIEWVVYDPGTRIRMSYCLCSKVAVITHLGEPLPRKVEHQPGPDGMDVYLGPSTSTRLKYHGEELPPRIMLGVQTRGSRAVRTVKAGQDGNDRDLTTTVDSWYSPELQLALLTIIDDPIKGKSRAEFTELVREEPPAGLFVLPPGYTELEK